MKNSAALAILCIFLATTHNSVAAEPELLGRWSFGPVYAIVEQNDHIFFSSGGVIRIAAVDGENGKWEELAPVPAAGVARGLSIEGDFLYVADEGGGIRIIDVSTPAESAVVGSCSRPEKNKSVCVRGDYAYVAAGWGGLGVIDVSDRTAPKFVTQSNTTGLARDVQHLGV